MKAREAGFSLVEMLAALMVLSIAGVALMNAVGQAASSANLARERALAQAAAQNVFNTLILEAGGAALTERGGDYEMAGRRWSWDLELEETADPGLQRVTLELSDAQTDAFAHSLTTFQRVTR